MIIFILFPFAGNAREAELMLALKLLLDQVSSGKINISPEMLNRSQNPTQTIEAGNIVVSNQLNLMKQPIDNTPR